MPRSRLWTVLAAVAVVLAALATAGLVRMRRFMEEDPRLCAYCHRASPEFALWNRGSHRMVACQRCHHNTQEEQIAMLRGFLAGTPPGGKGRHGAVEVGACAACHLSHDPRWPQVGGSRGHRIHVDQKHIQCVRCHAAGVHGFEPVQSSCRACHGQHAVNVTGMQQLHCFACHDFLSQDPGLKPTRRDCLRCHRAEGVLPARFSDDAPMQLACGACHKPHAKTKQEALVACSSCHPGVERKPVHAGAGSRRCVECHQPHLWRVGSRGR